MAGELDLGEVANVCGIYRVNVEFWVQIQSVESYDLGCEEVAVKPSIRVRVKRSIIGFWIGVHSQS